MSSRLKRVVSEIGRRIGPHKVQTAVEVLTCYAFDATNMKALPSAVVFPHTTDDVKKAVSVCHHSDMLVIPRGAGTGFAGGTVPLSGGIVISTERLNRIVSIDSAEQLALVESGVVNSSLQTEAAKLGLMFPPDPSSLEVATLGGNVAQDAGGPRALKYGVTRHYVLGTELVTCDGSVVESYRGSRNRTDWGPIPTLLTGSEGTLGIITRIWLRLVGRPGAFNTTLAFFPTAVGAAAAVSLILDSGLLPAAIELIDAETMDCIRGFVDVGIPDGAGCSLLIESDGTEAEARETMRHITEILKRAGAMDFKVAESEAEREDLWRMRRSISPSLARIAPSKVNEDVCVPRSRLPELVGAVGKLAGKYDLKVPTFGHAGDGNLHVNVMLDKHDRSAVRRADALVNELFAVTLDLDGTISGEHGVGVTKMSFLPDQIGPDGLEIQGRIKRAFDPRSLINPGKVITQE
jgi:glycolate oxidase